MKRLLGTDVTGTYSFDKTAKTVTFSGMTQTVALSNILLITNVTANTIIYNFADSTTGAVSFTNNILTLDYDTTSMNNADILQIYLDLESYDESLHALLRRMNKLLESNAVVDSSLRQRVAVEAMPTTTVTGTVTVGTAPTTAVTNTTGFGPVVNAQVPSSSPYSGAGTASTLGIFEGPVDQRWRIIDAARTTYGISIRTNLIFS